MLTAGQLIACSKATMYRLENARVAENNGTLE
jgi:hypothetical protein